MIAEMVVHHERPRRSGKLVADGITVALAGRRRPVLADVDLALSPGEAVGLLGRSGSGKTTLLHVINGLVPWLVPARVQGSVTLDDDPLDELDPGQRAHLLGSCLDGPDAQLFLPTPRHELAASQRLYGGAELEDQIVELLGVGPLLDRHTVELSSGERQRVALAVALAAAPRPVLLDEPCAHLDSGGAAALSSVAERVKGIGGAVLAAEHAGWRLAPALDRWLDASGGAVVEAADPQPLRIPSPECAPGDAVLLEARGVVAAPGGSALFRPLDLELHEGEVVVLSGANGVGKSSLARVLTGVASAAAGEVIAGKRGPTVLMLPEARLQLFAASVERELRDVVGRTGEVARVLRRHRLEAFAARAPWSLSRGERQRLVHAALDLLRPSVMVVDEPAQGLDPEDLVELVRLIHRRAARGRAYLIISHRHELAAAAHRHLRLADGGLEEVST